MEKSDPDIPKPVNFFSDLIIQIFVTCHHSYILFFAFTRGRRRTSTSGGEIVRFFNYLIYFINLFKVPNAYAGQQSVAAPVSSAGFTQQLYGQQQSFGQLLCLPLCIRLTANGIVKSIKLHREKANLGLKQLRIGSMCWFLGEKFEDLQSLLNSGLQQKSSTGKPQYYPVGGQYSGQSDDDNRKINIKSCPRCDTIGLVYDYTMKT